MCVIAIYKKGTKLNKKELERCFAGNPDGAGFMYREGDMVKISKGYYTFKALWDELSKLPIATDRVIHFRIATSGAISSKTCHPFPVTDDYKEMALSESYTDCGFAHNGVMPEFTPKEGLAAQYSDTMIFNHEVLSNLKEVLGRQGTLELLELAFPTSKYAILNKDGVFMAGNFEESPTSHALYSNGSYKYYYFSPTWYSTGVDEYTTLYFKLPKDSDYTSFRRLITSRLKDKGVSVLNYEKYQGFLFLYCICQRPINFDNIDGYPVNIEY